MSGGAITTNSLLLRYQDFRIVGAVKGLRVGSWLYKWLKRSGCRVCGFGIWGVMAAVLYGLRSEK